MRFNRYAIAPQLKLNLEDLGYKKPTDIQYKAIPSILKGEDVLAIAQTGTGKTAAFVIPILHALQKQNAVKKIKGVKCLVLVPTHELAEQVHDVFRTIGKHTRVTSYCIIGGAAQDPQIKKIAKGIDVLVATPGRMFDLISQGYLKLNNLQTLVLDEADHMLALGFIKDIKDLMRHIPKNRQTLFFSATINPEIKKLAYKLVKNALRIQLSPKNPVAKNINHGVLFIAMDEKRYYLERIVNENPNSKILAFVRTKVRAERVVKAMDRVGIYAESIHSDKTNEERSMALKNFKNGVVKLLIATDVSARGIDIPDVDFVINYDLPDTPENYVHRVGRTGRGRNKGTAYSFCSKQEKELLSAIEAFITKPVEVIKLSKMDHEATLSLSGEQPDDWRKLIKEAKDKPKKRKS